MTHKCLFCGHEQVLNTKFCTECGKPNKSATRVVNFCPKCGTEYNNNEKYCPFDGMKIIIKEENVVYR